MIYISSASSTQLIQKLLVSHADHLRNQDVIPVLVSKFSSSLLYKINTGSGTAKPGIDGSVR